ncbi:amino-acid N-acetyltransferase [Saccharopolyspora sp. NPDC000359]|uniref:amino-acid N-acetyltransferase n=1 Tax=Saccharopolyspora sp. NPDC000359 TaxID=3154251 RepID=UPI00331F58F4
MNDYALSAIAIRRARIADVPSIKALVDTYAGEVLLAKNLVTLYEDVQEFWVAELAEPDQATRVVGCGALHVLWEDLAEIRTVAVDPSVKGAGIGHRLVQQLVALARELGLARLFVLTFETDFFGKHGFRTVDGAPVSPEVYAEMRRSVDAGVAEFLDLANIKPNTLGNTRMLLDLT